MRLHFHVITNGDPERIELTKEAFDTFAISHEFHHFEKNKRDGKLGCFESHIKMLEYARDKQLDYICIAEDNIMVVNKKINRLVHLELNELIETSKWNIIICGGWFIPFTMCTSTSFQYIYKTTSIHGTSCYIIHKRFYKKILESYHKHMNEHIDYFYMSKAKKHAYILNPFLFRRNNRLATTNSYLINSVVDMYQYINCSDRAIRGWSFYSKHYKLILYLILFIILLLFCIIYIIYMHY